MRAVGVVRQSRGDDASRSTEEQRNAIERYAKREKWKLVAVHEEQDVSGRRALDKRPGLRAAVASVEAGEADVVVVAYFDRLVRSLPVQAEVVERVEAAGGRVVALDVGEVSHAKAAQWLQFQFLGAVAEYVSRTAGERNEEAKDRAIADGVPCNPRVPFGLLRDGYRSPYRPDPETAPLVAECFRMAAAGSTVKDIQRFLAAAGHERTYSAVQSMLKNSVYVGELHFGERVNRSAHEAVVQRDVFRRVQQRRRPRGGAHGSHEGKSRPKSDRLLARLGVLRCGSCGARMVVASATGRNGERVPVYRCPPDGACDAKQAITATIAEGAVVHAVRAALKDAKGRTGANLAPLEAALARAEADLANAIEVLSVVGDVAAAQEQLIELRRVRDEAADGLADARKSASFVIKLGLGTGKDGRRLHSTWDELTRDEQRELVQAVVEVATVSRGDGRTRDRTARAAGRVSVKLRESLAAAPALDRAAKSFSADLDGSKRS